MVPRRLVWFCDVSLTMQDLEQMFTFDLNKEINEHKAEDANGLQFGWKLAREERKFGEIRSFVANDKSENLHMFVLIEWPCL